MSTDLEILKGVSTEEYKYGFTTDIEMDFAPIGLSEETVKFISAKKNEPGWLLEWRLKGLQQPLRPQPVHKPRKPLLDIHLRRISQ